MIKNTSSQPTANLYQEDDLNEFVSAPNSEPAGGSKTPKGKRGRKRILNYEEIKNLYQQGLCGAAIARKLHLNEDSVTAAMRTMGIGTGRKNYRRIVQPNGKVRCRGCQKVKKPAEFNGSLCIKCTYLLKAKKCNEDLDLNLHVHYLKVRSAAKYRHVPFTITEDQIKARYFEQNGRDYYDEKTVLDIQQGKGRSREQISADRLDPDGPYSNENVVLTTQFHNMLKRRMDPAEFKAKLLAGELPTRKQEKEKVAEKTTTNQN